MVTQELTVYQFGKDDQRIQVVEGKEWICAPDACRILTLGNVTNALKPIPSCHIKKVKVDITDSSGRKSSRDMFFIDEAGLNQLIMRSNKPEAKRYQEWVFGTVLPAIRKTGSYVVPGGTSSIDTLQALKLLIDNQIVLEQRMDKYEIKQQETAALLSPVPEITDEARINKCVRQWVEPRKLENSNITYPAVYHLIYSDFLYRYGKDLKQRAKNLHITGVQAAALIGMSSQLLSLVIYLTDRNFNGYFDKNY
ncbi:MAG: BRO family protein [Dehalococcoidales bacterium]|nr:BRO family protein [Dehalococcoidales bacterium]